MATAAEIVFVGLCTFINVRNQDPGPTTPAPSVVVMKHAGHKNFIAFDSGKVTLRGGVTASQISTSSFYMIEFDPDGEELIFNDDRTTLPAVDSSYDQIASFSDYSGIASPVWDTNFIPLRNGLPVAGNVAAYVEFGGGTITADRLTKRKYHFTPSTMAPDPAKAKCFAREVHYAYDTTADGLLIEARSFKTRVKRTIFFEPKGSAKTVKIWIGASGDPLGDIKQVEPKEYKANTHFFEFYKAETGADDATAAPLPRPVAFDCAGIAAALKPEALAKPSKKHHVVPPAISFGEGDPEFGYCGPEGKP